MKNRKYIKLLGFVKGNNLKRFGFFLLAAFLFLLLTKLSETYTETVQFNIELVNLEEEIILTSDSTNTVDVVLSGKGFNLLPYVLYASNTITLDAKKNVYKTSKAFHWDAVNNRHIINKEVGNSVEVRAVKPDTLQLEYSTLASKTVPVILQKDISFASGFDVLGNIETTQDSVKLVGSETILKTISAIKTKPLILQNVSTNIKKEVVLDISNMPDVAVIPTSVEVIADVKQFTEGKILLPIEVVNAPIGKSVNYFPKQVELYYYVDLENFSTVKAKDFKVVADYKNLETNTQQFLELQLVKTSPLVKSTRFSQNRIEYIISQ